MAITWKAPFQAAAVLAAMGLFGCAGNPQQVDADEPTVTYTYTGDRYTETQLRADRYCARNYDGVAQATDQEVDGEEVTVRFRCVPEN